MPGEAPIALVKGLLKAKVIAPAEITLAGVMAAFAAKLSLV